MKAGIHRNYFPNAFLPTSLMNFTGKSTPIQKMIHINETFRFHVICLALDRFNKGISKEFDRYLLMQRGKHNQIFIEDPPTAGGEMNTYCENEATINERRFW